MGSRDFTYNLILKQDKESWAGGSKSVDNLATNISRLIGTAKLAAAAYAALKGVITGSQLASEAAMLSESLGVSVKRLEDWKVAAQIAGVSSGELTKSIGVLDRKFTEWKNRGKADTGIAVALGQLGLDAGDMFDMSADERARVILNAAAAMKDTKNAAALVSQLLGGAGERMYNFLRLSNLNIDSLLAKAGRISFMDDSTAMKGFQFSTEFNETIAALKQLGAFAGAEFGGGFLVFLRELNDFFKENKDDLKKNIKDFSGSLAAIAEAVLPIASIGVQNAMTGLVDMTGAAAALLNGDFEGALDYVGHFYKVQFENMGKIWLGDPGAMAAAYKEAKASGASTMEALDAWAGAAGGVLGGASKTGRNAIAGGKSNAGASASAVASSGGVSDAAQKAAIDKYLKAHGYPQIKDGIMRPDGRITQVAPDDWVFAARNIGDMAKMFVPQAASTTTYGGSSYTIHQTLNVQGAPFAQAAKRAAYDGTAAALNAFTGSAGRIQNMPGLR